MSYQFVLDGLMHVAVVDLGYLTEALPDGDVRGVRALCNPEGNGLQVPVVALSVSRTVTCLACVAKVGNAP